ncbi:hypothetical protein JTE90_027408 [Oedothorax gibbosus]|uniref:Uncharacterized protein n=1 Tax=Oedothorax gibbosus TaxID=931172 RepID=A0AAV6W2Z8_9ARAC|nr:hypothetical protein JTE90_027408 [Oedothorax gibbosus]
MLTLDTGSSLIEIPPLGRGLRLGQMRVRVVWAEPTQVRNRVELERAAREVGVGDAGQLAALTRDGGRFVNVKVTALHAALLVEHAARRLCKRYIKKRFRE